MDATELEKRQRRGALLDKMRALLDKAESQRRDLTVSERAEFDRLAVEVDNLGSQIGALLLRNGNSLGDLEADGRKSLGLTAPLGQPVPWPCFGLSRASLDDGSRIVRSDQRVADVVEHDLPDGPQGLSLGRLIRAMVTGDWRGAEAERRAMGGASDVLGGYLVPEPLAARVLDLARARSVLLTAGVPTVVMESSTLALARLTSDLAPGWRPENTALAESDLNFGRVNLTAYTLGCLTRLSVELLEDASGIDAVVEDALASSMALKLDYAGLLGSGAGEPLGLLYTDGVNVVDLGTDGGYVTYDDFSEAVQKVAEGNGTARTVVYSPRTAGDLDRLKDGNGLPLKPPQSFEGLQKLVSSQIPDDLTHGSASNASFSIAGDFGAMILGLRTNLTIEASRVGDSTTFSKLQVAVRGYLRGDWAVTRPKWFTLVKGILPR